RRRYGWREGAATIEGELTLRLPVLLAATVLLVAACEDPGPSLAGGDPLPRNAAPQFALGEDGALTVSTQNTILNAYSALAADAAAGSTTLVITSAGQLDLAPPSGPL